MVFRLVIGWESTHHGHARNSTEAYNAWHVIGRAIVGLTSKLFSPSCLQTALSVFLIRHERRNFQVESSPWG